MVNNSIMKMADALDLHCNALLSTVAYIKNTFFADSDLRVFDLNTAHEIERVCCHYGISVDASYRFLEKCIMEDCDITFDIWLDDDDDDEAAADVKRYVDRYDMYMTRHEYLRKRREDLPPKKQESVPKAIKKALVAMEFDYARLYSIRCEMILYLIMRYHNSANYTYLARFCDKTLWLSLMEMGKSYLIPAVDVHYTQLAELDISIDYHMTETDLVCIYGTSFNEDFCSLKLKDGAIEIKNINFPTEEPVKIPVQDASFPTPNEWIRKCQEERLLSKLYREIFRINGRIVKTDLL